MYFVTISVKASVLICRAWASSFALSLTRFSIFLVHTFRASPSFGPKYQDHTVEAYTVSTANKEDHLERKKKGREKGALTGGSNEE